MNRHLLKIAAVVLLTAFGCKNTNQHNSSDMNTNEPLKEVTE